MIKDSVNSISPLLTMLSIRKYLMTHHRIEDVSQILSNIIMTSSTFHILYSTYCNSPPSLHFKDKVNCSHASIESSEGNQNGVHCSNDFYLLSPFATSTFTPKSDTLERCGSEKVLRRAFKFSKYCRLIYINGGTSWQRGFCWRL